MKSNTDNAEKIQKLNELKVVLKNNLDAYNQFTQPIASLRAELRASDADSQKIEELTKKISLFGKKLDESECKKLEEEIERLRDQIEALEIEIYGKSHRNSPSFLMPGK